MKKLFALLLTLCLLVPFGTCGAFAAGSGWEIDYYVDDFGDPTDDAYIRGVFSGTFSNTATSNSSLTVVVFYDPDEAAFSFRLLEYDRVRATYSGSEEDAIAFKFKTPDGTVHEGSLAGIAPNGDLYLYGGNDTDTAITRMINAALIKITLDDGGEVRCIAEFSNSKYTFTVDGNGFRDCLAELEESKNAAAYAKAEALLTDGDKFGAAMAFNALGDYSDAGARSFDIWGEIAERDTISAGGYHTVSLRSDGTVVAVGDNNSDRCDVSSWSDIVAVSAGSRHTVGLRSDGTVVAVGDNRDGQCDVSGWSDIVAVSAGNWHTVGLRSNGTVVAVGRDDNGQCDVSGWSDIVAVSAGDHTVGLRSDGTVVAVGNNEDNQCNVGDWTDIVSISAGRSHTVGLRSNGTVVAVGSNSDTLGNYCGQCDVDDWIDIVAVTARSRHTAGLRSDGTVMAVGWNDDGRCDVSEWTDIKQP